MAPMYGSNPFPIWRLCAKAGLAFFCAGAACASPAGDMVDTAARPGAVQYSVINLGPGSGLAVLNRRGQVVFANWQLDDESNGFFDGHRVHALGSLGGAHTGVRSVNDLGVVVGESSDAQSVVRAFTWTVKGGMRALPGSSPSDARGINRRGQVVGSMQDMPLRVHARRWSPDGTLTSLGPQSARISFATAINDSGMAVGEAEVQRYDSHAMVWDADGKETDLGTFGGKQSAARHINAAGQVLGFYYREQDKIGFLWSRKHGAVQIGHTGDYQDVTDLNEHGDVTGNNLINNGLPAYRHPPFVWSQQRGLRALPLGAAHDGRALALNNRRQVVGHATRTQDGVSSQRAVYWNDVSPPVDLNTRLHRAPAGLVLHAAIAINDDGAIVAESNAGMVLLRPGRSGTAAPVLGPINGGAGDTVMPGDRVDLTVGFVDSDVSESHRASASIDDGCPPPAPSLRERRGVGDVSLRHTFCRAGTFTLKVKVTDRAGNATQVQRRLSVQAVDSHLR